MLGEGFKCRCGASLATTGDCEGVLQPSAPAVQRSPLRWTYRADQPSGRRAAEMRSFDSLRRDFDVGFASGVSKVLV